MKLASLALALTYVAGTGDADVASNTGFNQGTAAGHRRSAPPTCSTGFSAGCVWASTPPHDCPLSASTKWGGVQFGAGVNYESVGVRADTWYPSWGADGDLFTPFEDGTVVGPGNVTVRAQASSNGWAVLRGDDALKMHVVAAGNAPAVNASVAIFPRCNQNYVYSSLSHKGVWYLSKNCQGVAGPSGAHRLVNALFLGWPLGSIWSKDGGTSWTASNAAAREPLGYSDPAAAYPPPAMVAGRFVDFGRDMEHSPDGKAYVIASGCAPGSPPGECGYAAGDRITLGRVTLNPHNPEGKACKHPPPFNLISRKDSDRLLVIVEINDPRSWEYYASTQANSYDFR